MRNCVKKKLNGGRKDCNYLFSGLQKRYPPASNESPVKLNPMYRVTRVPQPVWTALEVFEFPVTVSQSVLVVVPVQIQVSHQSLRVESEAMPLFSYSVSED